jgi:hypothetical protein
MSDHNEPLYDLSDLKPVLYIFGVALTLMSIAGLIAFGANGIFAWFLLAGGLTLLATGYFAERILEGIAGNVDDDTHDATHSQRPVHGDTVAARKAS